jgi:ABC-2 type transport system ATP-binding protein
VEDVTDRFLMIYRGRLLAAGDRREIRAVLAAHPHRVRVRCDRVADLARALINADLADGLELEPQARVLSVLTRRPVDFFRTLPRIVEETGVAVEEMTSPDENLESVFRYLLAGRGGL